MITDNQTEETNQQVKYLSDAFLQFSEIQDQKVDQPSTRAILKYKNNIEGMMLLKVNEEMKKDGASDKLQ